MKEKNYVQKLADKYYRAQCQRLGAEHAVRPKKPSPDVEPAYYGNLAEDARIERLLAAHELALQQE